jgi:protein SCO1
MARPSSRRVWLRQAAALAMAAVSSPIYAHGDVGVVTPPVRIGDTWLVDQAGRKRMLSDYLLQGITAVQTIYTGCTSVCPIQGTLFSAVQEKLPQMRSRYPIRLLSIGIDPLSDSPAALREWLKRFQAGPAWNAATPSLQDVDPMRMALSGSRLPLGNIADHATQIYCFDSNATLRWRSDDLPRLDDICNALSALARA